MAQTAEKKKAGDGSTLQAVLDKKGESIPYEVVEEERMPGSRVRFKLKLTEEAVAGRLKEMLKEVGRQVTVRGFRPGKAPEHLVRRSYEPAAREEMVRRMVPRLSELFAGEKKLESLSQPYLLSWKSDRESGTTVEIALEVHPDIVVGDDTLADVKAECHRIKVDDTYVDRALQRLREQNATYEPTDEGYQTKDGILFSCEVSHPVMGRIAERSVENYYSTRLEEEVPEEVVAAIVGKKKGDTLSLEIEEDSDLEPGTKETIHYDVQIHEVKRRVLPELDDDFAMDVNEKYQSLDDLKKGVLEESEKTETDRQREEALAAVYRTLSERLDFDLPRALVQNTANRSISEMEERLNQYGMSLRTMDQEVVRNYAATMQEQAKQNVKNFLLVRALSRQMNIEPTDEQINVALEQAAARSGRKPLAVRAQLEARKQWDQFVEDLRLKLTNDAVLDKVEVTYKDVTVEEFEEISRRQQEERAAKLRGEQEARESEPQV